jgi:phage repressor protein C with HTH and peptisase S24 domain
MSAPMARQAGKVPIPRDRFPGLGPRAYALTVEGDSLSPRFVSGDVLVIDPDRIPKPGDMLVVVDTGRIADYAEAVPGVLHVIVGSERK